MIYKEHYIELFVNGNKLDLESQKSLNLRFQSVLYDPEKISSTQAEYSFEFEIPSTPNNDKIFDYANNLSKLNKFHLRWDAEVYADGTLIFSGSLTLNGYKNNMYNCNLVSVKVYSLEDIFGDSVLSDIPWEIPFDGAGTSGYSINYYNTISDGKVMFPFVSYGAFQKSPYNSDSTAKDYTSKFDIDEWNRWYVESFYPSLNMLETIKKAFEWKGYIIEGTAFDNVYLKDIFMSCNLADGQSPEYNFGNPKFGKVDMTIRWTNPLDTSGATIFDLGTTYGYTQDLKFPYLKSGNDYWDLSSGEAIQYSPDFNLKQIKLYDMMSPSDGGTVTMNQDSSYLYQPNEHLIVIPADGFYKIELSANTSLITSASLTASQWVHYWNDNTGAMSNSVEEKDITFNPDYAITTPLEIQLVRNYDDNIELIKGKNNIRINDGYPDHTTEMNQGRKSNYSNWPTCYPHEKLGSLGIGNPTDPQAVTPEYEKDTNIGYMPSNGSVMAYDPVVNSNFICGFSTMGNKNGVGTGAVIKNGYSWSKQYSEKNNDFYYQQGYYKVDYTTSYTSAATSYNSNEYIGSPGSSFNQYGRNMNGYITAMVYLKKNDVLQLYGVHRAYYTTGGTSVTYQTSANVRLKIEAASPKSYTNLLERGFGYNSNSDFSYNLKLTNFLNKETKISDWIQGIVDAYNLEVVQNGKNVDINVKNKLNNGLMPVVEIDDRVNSADAESDRIVYPKSMAVMYKIDTDEWGFEKSVIPQSKLNDDDWKDYGDSGFTVINLSDDSYVTSKSDKQLQFSYTWYDNFNWYPVDSSFNKTSNSSTTLRIPVISKYSYMIDGYDYSESMKHDGYGLSQRFWFRPKQTNSYVWTRTYPAENVVLYQPVNLFNNEGANLNLSYKVTEPSLLQQYFNITPYLASNYVTVDVYLSPEEYKMIKNGALVHFDSDLYYTVSIDGYDPSGNNTTTLKLMKRI